MAGLSEAGVEAAGLRPGGGNGDWSQPFELNAGLSVGAGNALLLQAGEQTVRLSLGVSYFPLSVTPSQSAEAPSSSLRDVPLVFAGYGISAPALKYDDYAGLDAHRAARVGSAAHGGQILVSAATRELIQTWSGTVVTDLGWFELKGLTRPEHLFQVAVPGLPAEFPPLRAQASSRARLPPQLTSLYGRETDVEAVAALLESGTRLLTLTGPGGIGKTRLALAVAERVEARYRDGVGFVALASVTDPDRVPETVASGLGRTVEGTASAEDVIVDELRDRQFLLVLDNFEQVADCAPLLRSLLERLPQLQILVSSRLALQLSVEREYGVAPLQVPETGAGAGDVASSAAVQLLLDRARTVRPDLTLTPENASALADLVRRLDGIPLAIELVAARLRLLDPADVLGRLASALDLGSGAVDLPPRQRTLRAAIDWSFELLAPPEQTLFRRLGVFVDGCTLEAAEAVIADADAGDVIAGLDTLAAHSLIRLETVPAVGVRIRMLVPLHDYAQELLADSGELEDMRARHASFFVRTVQGWPRGTGAGLGDWKRKLDVEWGNIRAGILWCVERSDHEGVARFLAALWPLLWLEDRIDETMEWLGVLRPHLDEIPPDLKAHTIHVDAFFTLEAGDYERAIEGAWRALEEAAAVGDEELEARSRLLVAGTLPAFDLDDPRIPELISQAITVFRGRGDNVNLAYALNFSGSFSAASGDTVAARKALEEALVLAGPIEALPIEAQSSAGLAFVDLIEGQADSAEGNLQTALKALDSTPNREILSYILDGYGWLALARGKEIEGLTALGAAEGLRSRIGIRVWPLTTAQIALLARLADSYQDPEAQAARQAGRQLTPEAALAVVTDTAAPLPAA